MLTHCFWKFEVLDSNEDCLRDNFYCQWFLSYYKLHFHLPLFLFCSPYQFLYNVVMILWNKSPYIIVYVSKAYWKKTKLLLIMSSFLHISTTLRAYYYLEKLPRIFFSFPWNNVTLLIYFFRREERNFITSIFMCSWLQYGLFVFDGILYVI